MSGSSFLNVYHGSNALKQYFDPDEQPMMPLVELPPNLNPFFEDSVHIYAKMMTTLPAQNIKALPAMNMIQRAPDYEKKPIIEASSGSTVISLALASRVLNQNDNVTAYVTNKTEKSRLQTLAFFGLKVSLYGGPAQPEIRDERGVISQIRRKAEQDTSVFAPCQYENENNWKSHIRWTGPQLLRQLPNISIFCAGMGSAGCVTGTGIYLKEHKPDVKVIGVCNRTGDSIPGPRPAYLFESITFPWKSVVDTIEEVDSKQSYLRSMQLSREGLICGPSSGMALQALLTFLQREKSEGRLQDYADSDGHIAAVFPCCDLPYQYMDNYFKKLDSSEFHPVQNSHLLEIDTFPYNTAWELEPWSALSPEGIFVGNDGSADEVKKVDILDIRMVEDFRQGTLDGAKNMPFRTVTAESGSPFEDVRVLEAQWKEMKKRIDDNSDHDFTGTDSQVVLFCYNGESARLLTSILRARGVEAYSIKGKTLHSRFCGAGH